MYTNNKLNGKLNGLFGRWIKKAMSYAVNVIADKLNSFTNSVFRDTINGYSTALKNEIASLSSTEGSFWNRSATPIGTNDITPSEETILDNWLQNKFMPYFENLLSSIDVALSSTSLQAKMTEINKQIAKMCVIREYYLVNETRGLSQNAINVRLELINELFNPVELAIKGQLGTTAKANVTANQNDFNGLFSLSVQGEVYSCGQYAVSQAQQQLVVSPIRTITPGTLPTSTPVAPVTQFTTLVPASPATKDQIYQNVIVPVDPQEETVTISKKGGFNWLAAFSAASVLLTAYSIFKKDKPKN